MLGLESQPPEADTTRRGVFARLLNKIKVTLCRKGLLKSSIEFSDIGLDISALPKSKQCLKE